MWPARSLAERKLRKAMWTGLAVDPAKAPAPERDLQVLIALADHLSRMDMLAKTLPESAPWHGLETDRAGKHGAAIGPKAARSGDPPLQPRP